MWEWEASRGVGVGVWEWDATRGATTSGGAEAMWNAARRGEGGCERVGCERVG